MSAADRARARRRPRKIATTSDACVELAPSTRVPAKADWPSYLSALARRGRLTAVFHPILEPNVRGAVGARTRTRQAVRTRMHGDPGCGVVSAAGRDIQGKIGRSLRRTLGFAADQAELARRDIALPDAATWCRCWVRRRRDPEIWDALSRAAFAALGAASSGPVTLLLDATGISLRRDGDWHRNKHGRGGDQRRGRFVKVHAGVDEATGVVVAVAVTGGDGRGSGDASQGPVLAPAYPAGWRPRGCVSAQSQATAPTTSTLTLVLPCGRTGRRGVDDRVTARRRDLRPRPRP